MPIQIVDFDERKNEPYGRAVFNDENVNNHWVSRKNCFATEAQGHSKKI
jgi:hypothetical protein